MRIAALVDKLERLRVRDRRRSAFGASDHQYRLGEKVPLKVLTTLERKLKVTFPDEYRAWLLAVGEGGAGPGYGLIPLEIAARRGPTARLDRPFPFSTSQGAAVSEARVRDPNASIPGWTVDGALPLAGHGCGWESVLVLDGEQEGLIWYGGDGWWPETAAGAQLSFFDWYEAWLDAMLVRPNGRRR